MPSSYPSAIDDFSESSPTYLADPDATGRTHAGRHDDVESAVEAVQSSLGVNLGNVVLPAGLSAHAADVDAHIPAGAIALGSVGALRWDETVGLRMFAWDTVQNRWQTVYADSGIRTITPTGGISAGTLYVRRVNNIVTWKCDYLQSNADNAVVYNAVEIGWHAIGTVNMVVSNVGTGAPYGTLNIAGNDLSFNSPSGAMLLGEVSYMTAEAWLASLPGVAAGGIPTGLPADD